MYSTLNYLLATYLQTREGGGHKIQKVEKQRPGKARFFFAIEPAEAEALHIKYHGSACAEFEAIRRSTIDLAY